MTVTHISYLADIAGSKQLVVDGRPYLILGAELQNSSFSCATHMTPIWQELVNMNVNTVLGPVTWEMIEPREGEFDFSNLDQLLVGARRAGLKLIVLWFGAWKNGMSTYVPSWVKMNLKRFPRAVLRSEDGAMKVTEIMTSFHEEILDADMKAFQALMHHLKRVDAQHSTVIMVQVENEVGILGDSRDRSREADSVFNAPVPAALASFIREDWKALHPDFRDSLSKMGVDRSCSTIKAKSWSDVFGNSQSTDELFMAYHYACYLDKIASAGKAIYPVPMFANFWLNYFDNNDEASQYPVLAGGGSAPGDYPSGGAVSQVLDVWMKFAPSLDFLSPDTYLNDYLEVCSTYRHCNQPLFIPEQRRDEYGARRIWSAIGSFQALGASPFGMDTLTAKDCAFTKHYALLVSVKEEILQAQRDPASIIGFFFDEPRGDDKSPLAIIKNMGGYELRIERSFTTGPQGTGYGLIIHLDGHGDEATPAKFLLVGAGFQVKFQSLHQSSYFTGILDFVEKTKDPLTSELATLRRLNGDETRSGQQAIMPNEEPDDGGFPIAITIPAKTRIAECTVYNLR